MTYCFPTFSLFVYVARAREMRPVHPLAYSSTVYDSVATSPDPCAAGFPVPIVSIMMITMMTMSSCIAAVLFVLDWA